MNKIKYYVLHGKTSEQKIIIEISEEQATSDKIPANLFKFYDGKLNKYAVMIQPDLLERIKQIESLIPDENKEEMSDLYDDVNYKCLMIDMNNEQNKKEGIPLINTNPDEIPPSILEYLKQEMDNIPKEYKQINNRAAKKLLVCITSFLIIISFVTLNKNAYSIINGFLANFSPEAQNIITFLAAFIPSIGISAKIKNDQIDEMKELADKYVTLSEIYTTISRIASNQNNKEKTTTLSPEGKRIKKQKQIAYLKSTKQVLLEMLKDDASEKKYQQSLSTQELYGNQQELLEQAQIPNTSSKEWIQEEKCEVPHAPVEKIGSKERRLYVTGIRRP